MCLPCGEWENWLKEIDQSESWEGICKGGEKKCRFGCTKPVVCVQYEWGTDGHFCAEHTQQYLYALKVKGRKCLHPQENQPFKKIDEGMECEYEDINGCVCGRPATHVKYVLEWWPLCLAHAA